MAIIDADSNFSQNTFLYYRHFNQKLNQFIQRKFHDIGMQNLHDHSNDFDPKISFHKIKNILAKKDDFIIFKPKIIFENFLLNPSYLIR